jgi:XTP/dITP diphosphohydrolase
VTPTFVLASANPDKVAEIAAILGDGVVLLPRPAELPDVVEDADTLEGNARLKAVAVSDAVGEAAVADDTGLEVEALGGAPGVHTARFAGEGATYADNVAKLLAELDGVAVEGRGARFRTVALARFPDGRELVAEGLVDGTISTEARGAQGFGYDPLFVPAEGDGRTFAEMSADEKHAISHRGRAFRALGVLLAGVTSGGGRSATGR